MTRKLIIVSYWLLLSGFLSRIITPAESQSRFGVYQDPDFAVSQSQFNPGQVAYIKVETGFAATETNRLRLLTGDSQRQIGETIAFQQSGADPYLYTASLALPSESGIYVFDVKLESPTSAYAVAYTVTVKPGGSTSPWPSFFPTVKPSPSAPPSPELSPRPFSSPPLSPAWMATATPSGRPTPSALKEETEEPRTAANIFIRVIKEIIFLPGRVLIPFLKRLLTKTV